MKKLLLATSALVASVGVASAQGVALSGSAEMGIVGGEDLETQYWNDVDVRFTLSGETDNGLTFGAVVDLDEAGSLGAEEDNQGTSVFISGNFGTFTLGDTDGALDRVMQDASTAGNPGSINDAETDHIGYVGGFGDGFDINVGGASYGDNQVARYEYSFADFLFAISYEQPGDENNATPGLVDGAGGDGNYALGVRYSGTFGAVDITAGLGYQSIDTSPAVAGTEVTIVGVSVLAEIQGFSGVIGYSDWEDFNNETGVAVGASDSHVYIGLGYEIDAFAFHLNYGEFDSGDQGYGLAVGYDLGGGASILFGYNSTEDGTTGADGDLYSLGVAMSF